MTHKWQHSCTNTCRKTIKTYKTTTKQSQIHAKLFPKITTNTCIMGKIWKRLKEHKWHQKDAQMSTNTYKGKPKLHQKTSKRVFKMSTNKNARKLAKVDEKLPHGGTKRPQMHVKWQPRHNKRQQNVQTKCKHMGCEETPKVNKAVKGQKNRGAKTGKRCETPAQGCKGAAKIHRTAER